MQNMLSFWFRLTKEWTHETAVAQQSNPPQHDKSVGKSFAKHLEFSNTKIFKYYDKKKKGGQKDAESLDDVTYLDDLEEEKNIGPKNLVK